MRVRDGGVVGSKANRVEGYENRKITDIKRYGTMNRRI